MTLWLIRAGSRWEHEQTFLDDRKVYVAWDGLNVDLKALADRQALIQAMEEGYPDEKGPPGEKEPGLLRKTRTIASLEHTPETLLLVTAANKGRNVGDMVLDARRDPAMWSKFNAGLERSAWYLLHMHQQLKRQMPQSRSVKRLGKAVCEILAMDSDKRLVPDGFAQAVWAAGYAERQEGIG